MIDTNELRRKLRSDDPIDHIDIHANVKSVLAEHFEYYIGDNECRPLENARAAIARATGEQP